MCIKLTRYCDNCEEIVELSEDGYCPYCGKHADNMMEPQVLHDNPGGYEPGIGEYYPANHVDPAYDNN